MDLWLVDVHGTAGVVDMWHHVDKPSGCWSGLTRRSIRAEILE